ncbi:hypothetical protein E2C01_021908 [Portunus trituberculatus]|uniref:Uncharacterized protein n=1 Tax=Portunus trituberculatus TaxID=210409 RepID=A0A5B7E4M7_PORTR|nr:hypothetical protein [Portunus trituberculatus]
MAQMPLGVGWLSLHPADLPRETVAMPQMCLRTMRPRRRYVYFRRQTVVVVDGDAERPLCVPATPYPEKSRGADSGEVAVTRQCRCDVELGGRTSLWPRVARRAAVVEQGGSVLEVGVKDTSGVMGMGLGTRQQRGHPD